MVTRPRQRGVDLLWFRFILIIESFALISLSTIFTWLTGTSTIALIDSGSLKMHWAGSQQKVLTLDFRDLQADDREPFRRRLER